MIADRGSPRPTHRPRGSACASPRPDREGPGRSFAARGRLHSPGSSGRRRIAFVRIAWSSVDVALDLELFAPDAMGFVPVYLGEPQRAVFQTDSSYAFAFSPPATAVKLPQPTNFADGRSRGDGFNISDFPDDL